MLNRSIITGRLVKDPELRYSPSGTAVANFVVAVNRAFDREKSDFIPVVCFKKQAENVCNHLAKGSLVGIDGRIQTSNWEKDGQRQYKTEIVADQVQFMDTKKDSGGNNSQQSNQSNNQSNAGYKDDPFANDGKPIDISDDDLPF